MSRLFTGFNLLRGVIASVSPKLILRDLGLGVPIGEDVCILTVGYLEAKNSGQTTKHYYD